jgi:HK97 family phage prohead protease
MALITGSLPETVLERLSPEKRSKYTAERHTKRGTVEVEVRDFARSPALIAGDEETWTLRGYATVYDVAYPIGGGPEAGGWMEIVERGATAKSIKDGADVRLLVNHDGLPLARTASGTMALISDDLGMMVDARLDPSSPYAQSARSAIVRKDADQMSFAFRVLRQQWNDDYTERRIKEVQLFDASIVTYPASEATVVQMNDAAINSENRAEDEAAEDDFVAQIRVLVAQLIAGEVADPKTDSPSAEALRALVTVLQDLDWFEYIDESEEQTENVGMMRSMSLGTATAIADALRLNSVS